MSLSRSSVYVTTLMGVRVLSEKPRLFGFEFDVCECTDVSEREPADESELDFVLEAPLAVWQEMLGAIHEHRGADAAHTLNTLSHLNDQIIVQYDDPEGHDKFYRFMASIQAYFDLARDVEIALN